MDKNSLFISPPTITTNQYIIGIGASAGGLEAINDLFDNMPSNTGFSFIIVQHLSPDHKSLMGELLSKHTGMPVFEAEDGAIPKPDCIYLIPIKKIITIDNGRLKLEDKIKSAQPNNVIDTFFESLAKDKNERTVAIILSGTGTDGTKGVQAIKNNGGIVIIQDPITAQFDGMPNSAISSGYVDLILSPDMMAEELVDFIKEAPLLRSFNSLTNQEEGILLDILELVYKTTGHDFSNYKRPTIHRRLARRMAERNIKSFADYYNFLSNHPQETTSLYKELLLHVTQFFRDEEAFKIIETVVIPDIISKKEPGDTVKVWTVACSTGEEVYSLAILFDEYLSRSKKFDLEIKIFASDISQAVIDIASRAIYTEEQVKTISADRLKKYFVRESGGYRIIPFLRKMVVFAKHDIVKDPPFSKIDLISCRNMLIYMNPFLQKNILQKFHFAISDHGYLFLGASENIGILKDVVIETDKKWKVYKCISKTRIDHPEAFSNPLEKLLQNGINPSSKVRNALNNLSDIFKETLLDEYDYAGILIDKDFEVKQAIGNFKKFMDFPEGSFNFNLLKLVPSDLSISLSTGIRKAIKDNERVVQKRIKIVSGKVERCITIIIKPYLVQKAYLQPFIFIILKEEEVAVRKISYTQNIPETDTAGRIEELEQELRETKESLQALIEEVESSNEELQSSNEEIISANEELQSTNEELQSLNEELHTVNAEHQLKIKELIELNDDLNNYFRNTDIGQILIDRNLIIRKFTPAATKQVNLITGDIGRSIIDISSNIRNLDFINDIKTVIQSGHVLEKEISIEENHTYLMRIAPYLRQNGLADGVVVNFIDITELTKISGILQAVFNSSANGIVGLKAIRDHQDKIVDFLFITSNKAAEKLLNLNASLVNRSFNEVYGHVDPKVLQSYTQVVETGRTTTFEFLNPNTNQWFEIIAASMPDGLVITFSDITDRKRASEKEKENYEVLKVTSDQLKDSNYKLEQSNFDLLQFASVASHDLKEPLRKIQVFGNLLKDTVDEKLNDAEKNYLEKVIKSTNRMQVLVDDILTLSRLSKSDTPLAEINLNSIINQIQDDLEVTIKEKGAKIIVQDLPSVKGVVGQVHQLFQNLISNAIKFNEGNAIVNIGEQDINAELQEEFQISPSRYSAIYIKDNGIGFEQVYADKIFGIFQRLEKTNYEGTGIGLAIVKKIVDNHKGFIKVTSEPGI
ncbi:MAG: chemotaxis protein CheB, partial [Bacteroidota bacterium]